MAEFAGIDADYLRTLIAKIERIEEEKAQLASDIRLVYAEAKASGFEPKIMRQLIRLRRMEPEQRQEWETMIDLYKQALGMR
ncbi:MAG: DUF2312 domain-containing protein [Magnetococcales bacterium]|nr:DUF2312 domain-containing protein [Magnetococcales bacterium]